MPSRAQRNPAHFDFGVKSAPSNRSRGSSSGQWSSVIVQRSVFHERAWEGEGEGERELSGDDGVPDLERALRGFRVSRDRLSLLFTADLFTAPTPRRIRAADAWRRRRCVEAKRILQLRSRRHASARRPAAAAQMMAAISQMHGGEPPPASAESQQNSGVEISAGANMRSQMR
jgi:hypothetical protein